MSTGQLAGPVLAAALAYARLGWCVLPLVPLDKKPTMKSGKEHAAATTDADTIRGWWTNGQQHDVAILAGARSELVVLDVDPRNGGHTSLATLVAKHGELPVTVEARTGGGGAHYYFAHPGGAIETWHPGEGLDLQADGGHLVKAPPSGHKSGTPYSWAPGRGPDDVPLAPLPAWLVKPKPEPRPRPTYTAPAMIAPDRLARYGAAVLNGEADDLARTLPGNRNKRLNDAGLKCGHYIPHILERGRVEAELFAACETNGNRLVDDKGVIAVRDTIKSGIEAGMREPRYPVDYGRDNGRPLRLVDRNGMVARNEAPMLTAEAFHLSDIGNAERLVRRHGRDLRYCRAWRKWLAWDGTRWTRDGNSEAERRAKETMRSVPAEAEQLEDGERRKAINWGLRSETDQRIRAMLNRAAVEPGIEVEPAQLDANPWLLGVLNGTVDLRTGKRLPHDRADLMTKLAPVEYDPAAKHAVWDAFLERMVPNSNVRNFLQRAAGYSLTGDTGEEVLFFVYGPTSAGKSTYTEALKKALGDYGTTADFSAFLRKRNDDGGPRNEIAALAGARMVLSLEMDEGRSLAEALVKNLTGGDTVKARFLYQEGFEFRPAFKLWLVANHKPKANAEDDAIWRRILLVPFEVSLPAAERNRAVKLALTSDPQAQAAILAWAVAGCLKWQKEGLNPPAEVVQATEAYRLECDHAGPFIDDCFLLDPHGRVAAGEVRRCYEAWCKSNGEKPVAQKSLAAALERHGLRSGRERGGRFWEGISPR